MLLYMPGRLMFTSLFSWHSLFSTFTPKPLPKQLLTETRYLQIQGKLFIVKAKITRYMFSVKIT